MSILHLEDGIQFSISQIIFWKIENCWAMLKRLMPVTTYENRDDFVQAIRDAWAKITVD